MTNRIEMRLMGTEEDLQRWLWFVGKMEERGLIKIIENSKPYKNRGESQQLRRYLKIDLLLEPPPEELQKQ